MNATLPPLVGLCLLMRRLHKLDREALACLNEVYVPLGGAWKLASLSFTRLLTPQ